MEWLKVFKNNNQLLGESSDLWCDIPDAFKRYNLAMNKEVNAVFDHVRFERKGLKGLLSNLKEKFGLNPVWTAANRKTEHASFILGSDTQCAIFSVNDNNSGSYVEYSFDLFSSDYALNIGLRDYIRELNTEVVASPEVYVLTNHGGGYSFTSIGEENHTLEEGNYNKDVLSKYDHMVEDLGSQTPCGKFNLLEGEPGVGKSFLIRGLINKISKDKNCMCVVVPPYLTSGLADPGLISAFINHKNNNKNQRIVLILEDADSVIVTRMSDNMSHISSLLNITDGILGNLLNIRIIASTNAIDELDEALERNGRMCSRIHVTKLDKKQATDVFKRITAGKEIAVPDFSKGATLADIYKKANFENVDSGVLEKVKIGFNA